MLQVREISEVINSGIQPIQNLSVMNRVSDEPAKRVEWSKYWIEKGLAGNPKLLLKILSTNKYSTG